jgi:hypothetical protein
MSGPQTFAPGRPGKEQLDSVLVQRNKQIQEALASEAAYLRQRGYFRWFFTLAHGEITRLINKNIESFQRPNALMLLNIHFAEQFVRALWGQPHQGWQKAFNACKALQSNAELNPALIGEIEFCGAAMANVHILVDLSDALDKVGCIPPEDYGNMLVFVNHGSMAAVVDLRGRALGSLEMIVQYFLAPMVDLEVKVWRNAAYKDRCNVPVPDPNPTFRPRL